VIEVNEELGKIGHVGAETAEQIRRRTNVGIGGGSTERFRWILAERIWWRLAAGLA
jgi:hypothetical protein